MALGGLASRVSIHIRESSLAAMPLGRKALDCRSALFVFGLGVSSFFLFVMVTVCVLFCPELQQLTYVAYTFLLHHIAQVIIQITIKIRTTIIPNINLINNTTNIVTSNVIITHSFFFFSPFFFVVVITTPFS